MLTRQEMLLISKFIIKSRQTIRELDTLLAEGNKQTLKNRNATIMRGLTFVPQTKARYEKYVKKLKRGENPEEFLKQASECADRISRVLRGDGIEGLKFYVVIPGQVPIGPYATKTDAAAAMRGFRKQWYLENRTQVII